MLEYKSQNASPPSSLSSRGSGCVCVDMLDMLTADTAIWDADTAIWDGWDDLDADPLLSLSSLRTEIAFVHTCTAISGHTLRHHFMPLSIMPLRRKR